MPIHLLHPDLVAKIAAGEVVGRPASAVKELVENSLDAGARQISVEVQGGGVGLIRVSDDGAGIPPEEAELIFQRHATSKIASLADLEGIATLGFRGEALASIAAVAEVEIVTCAAEADKGLSLHWKDGVVERVPSGRSRGTTVTVRHLFRSFPARLKFLKSEASERSQVANVVSHYALSFPEVRFSLMAEGRRLMSTSGNGSLRDVLAENYGSETAREMLEVRVEKGAAEPAAFVPRVTGLLGPPSVARSNRSHMSFFVNRRWVQSRLLSRAVEEGYQGSLQVGRYPLSVLNIALPPSELDVNVHPAKTEVKFRNDSLLFGTVMKAVRQTLLSRPVPEMTAARPAPVAPSLPAPSLWPESEISRPTVVSPPVAEKARPGLPILRVLGQASATYIIAEGPGGLYLIDQHAAHERVLFENILAQHSRQQVEKQGFLEPVTLELSPQEEETLRSSGAALAAFGFEIEPFGGRGFILRAVPAMLQKADFQSVVREILSSLAEGKDASHPGEKLAISIACHSAVRAGQMLSMTEMQELIGHLEKSAMPRTCPHGRPTMVHLSSSQLEKEFGRT
ncbi:MAG: DNA mismatch repair endonuclease MutL [Dehalococcoidia bacterium]|nr:DNA mismatch repair endonuclease MutL [Dehalococcoidia bacterium]